MIKGADISSLSEVERCNGHFYDNGEEKDLITILKENDVSLIRLRLFNDPFDENGNSYLAGGCDFQSVHTLAERSRQLGLSWYLDFHYSDCWADPGKQTVPKAWQNHGLNQLIDDVYDYTYQTLLKLKEDNLLPSIVSIGNEITNGLLWPVGKAENFSNMVQLLNSGIRAVRDIDENIKVMLHLDNGGNNALYRWFFDNYFLNNGNDFDIIGLSYYPFWHGTLKNLKNNLDDLAERYQKEMIIVETAYAFTLADWKEYEKLSDESRKGMSIKNIDFSKLEYEISVSGQSQFLTDLAEVCRSNPLTKGFIYWEIGWLPVEGSQWASEKAIEYMHEKGPGGNEWANMGLFDYDGNSLHSLKTLKKL